MVKTYRVFGLGILCSISLLQSMQQEQNLELARNEQYHGIHISQLSQVDILLRWKDKKCRDRSYIVLDLSDCNIGFLNTVRIGDREFKGIDQIPGIERVDILYLNNNKIVDLQGVDWSKLPFLRTLDLSDNRIAALARDAWKGLNNLTELFLNKNCIELIDGHSLTHMPQLNGIFLGSNLIEKLPEFAFDGSEQLTEIDLNDNSLIDFAPELIPSTLQKLCLAKNEIDKEYKPKLLELIKQQKSDLEVQL